MTIKSIELGKGLDHLMIMRSVQQCIALLTVVDLPVDAVKGITMTLSEMLFYLSYSCSEYRMIGSMGVHHVHVVISIDSDLTLESELKWPLNCIFAQR